MVDYQEAQINDEPLSEPIDKSDIPDEAEGATSADSDDAATVEAKTAEASVGNASDDAIHKKACVDDAAEEAPTVADVITKLNDLTNLFRTKISRSKYEEQVLKRYSDEIHEYKADLHKKITLPLIKEVIGVRDATRAILERARSENAETDSISIDSVEFISEMLETALDNHGVTVHTPIVGDLPDKATERPVGRVKTATAEMHGTIAAVMNDAYMMDGKCVASAKVKLFAYDPTLKQQEALVQTEGHFDAVEDGSDNCAPSKSQEKDSVEQIAPAPVYKPE